MSITRVGIVGFGNHGLGIAEVAAAAGHEVCCGAGAGGRRRDAGQLEEVGGQAGRKGDEHRSRSGARLTPVRPPRRTSASSSTSTSSSSRSSRTSRSRRTSSPSSTASASPTPSSPRTPRRCRWSRWRWRPGGPTWCAASTSSTRPRMALVEVVRPITASDATVEAAVRSPTRAARSRSRSRTRPASSSSAALPVPEQRRAPARAGRGHPGGHRRRHEGRLRLPHGPFALLDLVGLDTSLAILDALYEEFRDPNYAAVPLLRRLVTAGQLGRKTKKGFYDYSRDAPRGDVERRQNGRCAHSSGGELMAPTPRRDAPWLMRTYSGHSTARPSNELYRTNLAKGQTGLSIAFDLPTQTGYDPDHPRRGRSGQGRCARRERRAHGGAARTDPGRGR